MNTIMEDVVNDVIQSLRLKTTNGFGINFEESERALKAIDYLIKQREFVRSDLRCKLDYIYELDDVISNYKEQLDNNTKEVLTDILNFIKKEYDYIGNLEKYIKEKYGVSL